MTLPAAVRAGVESALRESGHGSRVVRTTPVGGGCINHGARIGSERGGSFFLKWNDRTPTGMFDAEADGLRALRECPSVDFRVPEPVAWGADPDRPGLAWLLMEHVAPGAGSGATDERLGRGLATLHAGAAGHEPPGFGWPRDNWIGSLEQENAATSTWAAFWRDRRIVPQLERARAGGLLTDSIFDRLVEAIPGALRGVDESALLHGDLWSGNAYPDRDGTPVLIDPAVYRGHGEVDLAMTELFGGFGPRFYGAYAEAAALSEAYHAYRRSLYQLYYLIVHVNLFGGSYLAGSRRAAEDVLRAL